MNVTHTVAVTRSGDWWAINVPEVPGAHTQARRFDQVEATARHAIAQLLDVAPDSFEVVVKRDLDEVLDEELPRYGDALRRLGE